MANLKSFTGIFALALLMVALPSCKKEGCTNPIADNYDSDAKDDDGTCIFKGCTDMLADNYDSLANEENGSCIYPSEQFLGNFDGTDACGTETESYFMNISAVAGDVTKVSLNDFAGWDENVQATATNSGGSYLLNINDTQGGKTFDGSGALNGSSLIINYTVTDDTGELTCTSNLIKQP